MHGLPGACPGNRREPLRSQCCRREKAGATLLGARPTPIRSRSSIRTAPRPSCSSASMPGALVPAALGDLGIAAAEMDRHIAYDIGAEGLSRKLSARSTRRSSCSATAGWSSTATARSRRRTACPRSATGRRSRPTATLADADRLLRFDEIHRPFHDAIGAAARCAGSATARPTDSGRPSTASRHASPEATARGSSASASIATAASRGAFMQPSSRGQSGDRRRPQRALHR